MPNRKEDHFANKRIRLFSMADARYANKVFCSCSADQLSEEAQSVRCKMQVTKRKLVFRQIQRGEVKSKLTAFLGS